MKKLYFKSAYIVHDYNSFLKWLLQTYKRKKTKSFTCLSEEAIEEGGVFSNGILSGKCPTKNDSSTWETVSQSEFLTKEANGEKKTGISKQINAIRPVKVKASRKKQ